jgi:hypothetical protein
LPAPDIDWQAAKEAIANVMALNLNKVMKNSNKLIKVNKKVKQKKSN